MTRIATGDQEAFECLLARHLDSIHRYTSRLVGNSADADDLAQETFIRVWQRANTYQPGKARLATWLHTIAHNLCIDLIRRPRPVAETPDELPHDTDGPDQHVENGELSARLNSAIRHLPESQRYALTLCHIQGFSNKEAAAVLGVNLRALESLLARARKSLRRHLGENFRPDA
jgi:RNA polymerase sigma-70 factor (ECF subfamily)